MRQTEKEMKTLWSLFCPLCKQIIHHLEDMGMDLILVQSRDFVIGATTSESGRKGVKDAINLLT